MPSRLEGAYPIPRGQAAVPDQGKWLLSSHAQRGSQNEWYFSDEKLSLSK